MKIESNSFNATTISNSLNSREKLFLPLLKSNLIMIQEKRLLTFFKVTIRIFYGNGITIVSGALTKALSSQKKKQVFKEILPLKKWLSLCCL